MESLRLGPLLHVAAIVVWLGPTVRRVIPWLIPSSHRLEDNGGSTNGWELSDTLPWIWQGVVAGILMCMALCSKRSYPVLALDVMHLYLAYVKKDVEARRAGFGVRYHDVIGRTAEDSMDDAEDALSYTPSLAVEGFTGSKELTDFYDEMARRPTFHQLFQRSFAYMIRRSRMQYVMINSFIDLYSTLWCCLCVAPLMMYRTWYAVSLAESAAVDVVSQVLDALTLMSCAFYLACLSIKPQKTTKHVLPLTLDAMRGVVMAPLLFAIFTIRSPSDYCRQVAAMDSLLCVIAYVFSAARLVFVFVVLVVILLMWPNLLQKRSGHKVLDWLAMLIMASLLAMLFVLPLTEWLGLIIFSFWTPRIATGTPKHLLYNFMMCNDDTSFTRTSISGGRGRKSEQQNKRLTFVEMQKRYISEMIKEAKRKEEEENSGASNSSTPRGVAKRDTPNGTERVFADVFRHLYDNREAAKSAPPLGFFRFVVENSPHPYRGSLVMFPFTAAAFFTVASLLLYYVASMWTVGIHGFIMSKSALELSVVTMYCLGSMLCIHSSPNILFGQKVTFVLEQKNSWLNTLTSRVAPKDIQNTVEAMITVWYYPSPRAVLRCAVLGPDADCETTEVPQFYPQSATPTTGAVLLPPDVVDHLGAFLPPYGHPAGISMDA